MKVIHGVFFFTRSAVEAVHLVTYNSGIGDKQNVDLQQFKVTVLYSP